MPEQTNNQDDLVVDSLIKSFVPGQNTLDGVSFSVPHGQQLALVGSNGCGKSTMMRCILRLIEPDSGSIKLFGNEIMGKSHRALRESRRQVGFVFQKHNLVPRMSALTNVIHGSLGGSHNPLRWFQGFAPSEVRDHAMECLDSVGLAHLAGRSVERLSGGESQRVAIARALMQDPKMIFADEPVASLDPKVGEEVMELFVRLSKEKGITLVFISHHMEHALSYATRVIGLKKGSMEFDKPSAELDVNKLRSIYE